MSEDSFTITDGDVKVKVEGLTKTLRKLAKAGVDATDMKSLMHEIGMLVVNDAAPPRASGALADSMRAGRGKTKAVVRAGGAKVKYAGVVHYGWPARTIKAQPFLLDSLKRQRSNALGKLEEGIGDILKKNGLT